MNPFQLRGGATPSGTMAYSTYDICIRGSGIVGRTLALLLARHRLRVGLVESPAPASSLPDIRAYALNHRSQRLLAGLKCWPAPELATPVREMRVTGDGGGHTRFEAEAMGEHAMTWIVDVPALEHMLQQACQYQSGLDVLSADEAGRVRTALTVVCEGKHSATRAELGVDYDVTPYRQTAIATRATLDAPHGGVAWQWFSHTGSMGEILAFLPLGGPQGQEVAVVWSVDRERVDDLLALDDDGFAAALQLASHLQPEADGSSAAAATAVAPDVVSVARRMAWPLQLGLARRWAGLRTAAEGKAAGSWVLAGDAAHSVHPLAGQGLNLGLADAELLGALVGERPYWRGPGDMHLLRQYERTRKAEIAPLVAGMDGIQQLFAHNSGAARQLRNLGLSLFDRSGPLKQFIARRAMG